MKTKSLIIPVYNEEDSILILFKEILSTGVYEVVDNIIYIDDSSNDDSLSLMNNIQVEYKKVIVLKNSYNRGQSFSIFKAAEYSNHNLFITLDGDGQNNPLDILKLLEVYLESDKYSLVSGLRIKRKDSMVKIISSKVANLVRMKILKDDCPYTGCSLKVFDREIFLSFPYFDGMHRFLPALFKGFGKKFFL